MSGVKIPTRGRRQWRCTGVLAAVGVLMGVLPGVAAAQRQQQRDFRALADIEPRDRGLGKNALGVRRDLLGRRLRWRRGLRLCSRPGYRGALTGGEHGQQSKPGGDQATGGSY